MMRCRRRRAQERGALLGIVLVLLGVLLGASAFAVWGLRGDTGAAGRDRLSRQLVECAEEGLAFGKQYFSNVQRTNWNLFLNTNACALDASLCAPYGPFPNAGNGVPPPGYLMGPPYRKQISLDGSTTSAKRFEYQVGIYNDPEASGPTSDGNNQVIVYARCREISTGSGMQRAVQALITSPMPISDDYTGQAGRGFRNQGNGNY
jgi:hypothetical protein